MRVGHDAHTVCATHPLHAITGIRYTTGTSACNERQSRQEHGVSSTYQREEGGADLRAVDIAAQDQHFFNAAMLMGDWLNPFVALAIWVGLCGYGVSGFLYDGY